MTNSLFLLAVLLAATPAWGQQQAPAYVSDCHPCSFSPGGNLPVYSFRFDLKTTAEGRVVESIEVATDSGPVQRLPVAKMQPIGNEEQFFFGGMDINFDGMLDLMLILRRGVANACAEYWLFDPKTAEFTELGTYPVFRVDAESRRLTTYDGGGAGGLIFDSKEYAFLEGKLMLVREERQDATKQPGVFRNVIRERLDGAMKVTKTANIPAPKSN